MANRNPQPDSKTSPAAAKRSRRASQRGAILGIDLAREELRNLMIEQRKTGSGPVRMNFLTVYSGSRAELIAAGIPAAAFPIESEVKEFQVQTVNCCSTGSREQLSGVMRSIATGFELKIDWQDVMPYSQCAHPAICELARRMQEDVWRLTQNSDRTWSTDPDLENPITMLVADERAVDYKSQPGAPKLQVTPEFHKELSDHARHMYLFVHLYGEVMPSQTTVTKVRPHLRIVANR